MKQFLRYLLLIACVMMTSAWIWSFFFDTELWNNDLRCYNLRLLHGTVYGSYGHRDGSDNNGWKIRCRADKWTLPLHKKIGLTLPIKGIWQQGFYDHRVNYGVNEGTDYIVTQTTIGIPIWLLFTPLFLLTAGLWYRPIRDRLDGKTGKGFEVEIKSEEPK